MIQMNYFNNLIQTHSPFFGYLSRPLYTAFRISLLK